MQAFLSKEAFSNHQRLTGHLYPLVTCPKLRQQSHHLELVMMARPVIV